MMAGKARLFGDDEVEAQIRKTTDPKKQKALGRKVSLIFPRLSFYLLVPVIHLSPSLFASSAPSLITSSSGKELR